MASPDERAHPDHPATTATPAREPTAQHAEKVHTTPEALARARLARELAAIPPEETPAFWAHVRATGEAAPSLGALVVLLRRARAREAVATQRDLFTLILERISGLCAAWVARVVARTPGVSGEAAFLREDLCQELTLYLWERTANGADPAWERYFQRSLDYAQRHIATRYMERTGYWVRPGVRHPERGVADSLSVALAAEFASGAGRYTHDGGDSLAPADLADLRALALRLPLRERIVIVLRFWQQASEAEIAAALGGATTRTVRNIQRRALTRLRIAYLAGQATARTGLQATGPTAKTPTPDAARSHSGTGPRRTQKRANPSTATAPPPTAPDAT